MLFVDALLSASKLHALAVLAQLFNAIRGWFLRRL
jgi:hypothetical protein